MPTANNPVQTNNQQSNPRKRSKIFKAIFWIILIWLLFFWHACDSQTTQRVGNQKPGFPSASVISNSFGSSPTLTEYNGEYLRWAGPIKAGQYAAWSNITIEQQEIPVGDRIGPRPPCIVYGNIREMTGAGITLVIFDEANYMAWRNGQKNVSARFIKQGITDTNYLLDISRGSSCIVLDNRKGTQDVFVGFTGAQAYVRPLSTGETPLEQNQHFAYVWEMKNEKLTIFKYLLRLFKPSYNVSVTPPSIS